MQKKVVTLASLMICLVLSASAFSFMDDCQWEYDALDTAHEILDDATTYRDSVCPDLPGECAEANTYFSNATFEVWDREDDLEECLEQL